MNVSEVPASAQSALGPKSREALDEKKKEIVLRIISRGCSRRVAARFVDCAHTTIARTAARDKKFAEDLAVAENWVDVEAMHRVRKAGRDDKYWRAAAWLLERRNPDEYGRRDANSFTPDQVMTLLTRFFSSARICVQADKVQEFQQLLDDALEDVAAQFQQAGNRKCIDVESAEADKPDAVRVLNPSDAPHVLVVEVDSAVSAEPPAPFAALEAEEKFVELPEHVAAELTPPPRDALTLQRELEAIMRVHQRRRGAKRRSTQAPGSKSLPTNGFHHATSGRTSEHQTATAVHKPCNGATS